jgi:hypothetical protein
MFVIFEKYASHLCNFSKNLQKTLITYNYFKVATTHKESTLIVKILTHYTFTKKQCHAGTTFRIY